MHLTKYALLNINISGYAINVGRKPATPQMARPGIDVDCLASFVSRRTNASGSDVSEIGGIGTHGS